MKEEQVQVSVKFGKETPKVARAIFNKILEETLKTLPLVPYQEILMLPKPGELFFY